MRFSEFASAVEDLARRAGHGHVAPSEFVKIGQDMGVGGRWRCLLESARDCLEQGSLERGSSHDHENGFQKIGLFRSNSTGVQIRLHVWHGSKARDTSSIHDHRWDFASFVLLGGLFARNYRIVQPDDRAALGSPYVYRRLYDAVPQGALQEAKQSSHLGHCLLSAFSEYQALAGAAHCLSHDVPHTTYPMPGSTVTASLVITGPPAREYSTQFLPPAEAERFEAPSAKRSLFHMTECSDRIAALLAAN